MKQPLLLIGTAVLLSESDFTIHIVFCCIFPVLYNAGISIYHTVTGNITIYITIRSNQHIIADGDFTNNGCVNTDPDGIADFGRTFPGTTVFLSDGNALVKITVFSDFNTHIDGNIIGVSKI